MSATVYDVAREAKVSIATVSRVLNKQGNVSDKTISKVMTAAKRLNYAPNVSARSLMKKPTGVIGMILPDIRAAHFLEFVRGADESAGANDKQLLISCSQSNADDMLEGLAAMRGKVDGVIIVSPEHSASRLMKAVGDDLPIVLINSKGRRTSQFPAVKLNNVQGAEEMTEHLISVGHRRITLIAGPEGHREAQERITGYETAMKAHRLKPDILQGNFTEQSGYEAGELIAKKKTLPDAVFASNDAMAIGCLSAFEAAEIQVPDKIALAGFDDIPIARYMRPPLTTMRAPFEEMGATAFKLLHKRLSDAKKGEAPRSHTVSTVSPELVIRKSTSSQ